MSTPSYELVGIQGYVSPTPLNGYLPLKLYWSNKRKDYYTVASVAGQQDAEQNNYVFVGIQGYVLPGPYWSAPLSSK